MSCDNAVHHLRLWLTICSRRRVCLDYTGVYVTMGGFDRSLVIPTLYLRIPIKPANKKTTSRVATGARGRRHLWKELTTDHILSSLFHEHRIATPNTFWPWVVGSRDPGYSMRSACSKAWLFAEDVTDKEVTVNQLDASDWRKCDEFCETPASSVYFTHDFDHQSKPWVNRAHWCLSEEKNR